MNEVIDDARRAKLRRLNELNQEMLAHVELAREETLRRLEERWGFKPQPMLEKEIEKYFVWTVERMGGKTWKFTSPGAVVLVQKVSGLLLIGAKVHFALFHSSAIRFAFSSLVTTAPGLSGNVSTFKPLRFITPHQPISPPRLSAR